jgi:peptidoglycan/xylan/chitin deacetylase (PgdA/CDA1 family)
MHTVPERSIRSPRSRRAEESFIMARLGLVLGMVAVGAVAASCAADGGHDHDEEDADAIAAEWNEAYERHAGGKADQPGCSGVLVPDQGGFAKRVALTFDDGPNPATTPKVLDVLAAHGIKATFFINGMRVKSSAEKQVLARIVSEGHLLANHSQQHLNLSKVSLAKLDQQVKLTGDAIAAAGPTPRYFRFPFGASTCATAKRVRDDLGYIITGWHVDSADWCYAAGGGTCKKSTFKFVPDAHRADMVGYTLHQIRQKGGGVALFHDIHAHTAAKIETIVAALESEGFTFTNLDDEETFPKLHGLGGTTQSFVGTVCAADGACAFTSGGRTGFCHEFTAGGASHGFCSLGCEGHCPDQPGKAPTFCTSLDGGASGACVSKAGPLNATCTAIPGTSPHEVQRFVGASGAGPATALACVP